MEEKYRVWFTNALILAPMVRISTLPMRLLSLDYGADIVYCEEIIDFKLLKCKRVENLILDTVDFVHDDGTIVFRTCASERDKVVFQIGTCDAVRALQVAKMVLDDVAAIDVNMGCPKEFSIKGGMGAALLSQPEKVVEILTALVRGIQKPVTCKIRILSTVRETVELAKLIEGCGVAALTVHGRTRDERPNDANHDDVIAAVAKAVAIPVIANGGSGSIQCYEDIIQFKTVTCCTSVMLARCAQWNPSIFSLSGIEPIDEVLQKYIKYAVLYDSNLSNFKYCVQQLLHDTLETQRGRMLLATTSIRDICAIWGLEGFYDQAIVERKAKMSLKPLSDEPYSVTQLSDGLAHIKMPYRYDRKEMASCQSAKFLLHQWALQNKLDIPRYETTVDPSTRLFNSVLTFGQHKYSSTTWEKSKKWSEQVAAVICLHVLHLKNDGTTALPVFPAVRAPAGSNPDERTCCSGVIRKKQTEHDDDNDTNVDVASACLAVKKLKSCSQDFANGSDETVVSSRDNAACALLTAASDCNSNSNSSSADC